MRYLKKLQVSRDDYYSPRNLIVLPGENSREPIHDKRSNEIINEGMSRTLLFDIWNIYTTWSFFVHTGTRNLEDFIMEWSLVGCCIVKYWKGSPSFIYGYMSVLFRMPGIIYWHFDETNLLFSFRRSWIGLATQALNVDLGRRGFTGVRKLEFLKGSFLLKNHFFNRREKPTFW